MNARQKAKYWKKKYDQLANTPIYKSIAIRDPIDTLQVEKVYPYSFAIHETQKDIYKRVKHDLAEGISEQIDRYVNYQTEFIPDYNVYRFSGSIQVVCKSKEE